MSLVVYLQVENVMPRYMGMGPIELRDRIGGHLNC